MNKFRLVMGDWSKDGHNQSDEYIYECNYSVEEVREAYLRSCKLTRVQFHSETGEEEWDIIDTPWTNYEDRDMTEEAMEVFKKFDIWHEQEDDGYVDCPEDFIMEFIGLSLGDFKFEKVKDPTPALNGWWGPMNFSFGYGLYGM